MLETVKMRWAENVYLIRSNGLSSFLREMFFVGRRCILVQKELTEVIDRPEPLTMAGMKVLGIDEAVLTSGLYQFSLKHRHLRACYYSKLGYGGFALARDNVIVGDLWYWPSGCTKDSSDLHEHLRWFGFAEWRKNDVYTFDIFVAPSERKQGVSAAFQNSAMLCLRGKGFTIAYGWYFADNVPAIWCTRITNKWKELRSISVSRLLIFRRLVPFPEHEAGSKV